MEEKNAKLESTMLGFEGHGIMSFMLHFSYGGSVSQGLGGWVLGGKAFDIIPKILKTLDVETWEDLPGQLVRVRIKDGRITELGHYLEDQWINPSEFFKTNALR